MRADTVVQSRIDILFMLMSVGCCLQLAGGEMLDNLKFTCKGHFSAHHPLTTPEMPGPNIAYGSQMSIALQCDSICLN